MEASNDENVVPFKAKRSRNRTGLSGAAVTGLNLDAAGSAEVVEIAQIQVDPEYQRNMRWEFVNEIAQAYDIVKAGPILVSVREDGSMWSVDGQHRMAGAEQAGETEMLAHVVHGLTREEEAELRLARNNRKSDTTPEKFKTRLVMGDPQAHAVKRIVEKHDLVINLTMTQHGGINAIATLEAIYEVDHKGLWLNRTLSFLREAYPEDLTSEVYSTNMMKAVAWYIGQHVDTKEVNLKESIERVANLDVDDIKRKAVSHKAALGGAMWLNYYRALVEIWNYRRTEAKQITWKTRGSIQSLGHQNTSGSAGRRQLQDLHDRYSES
jgi:hypothetical protein